MLSYKFCENFLNRSIKERLQRELLKGSLLGRRQFLTIESLLKNMKTAIYFMLKARLFIRYLNFCIDFLARLENGWIRKLRLVSRFMTSHTGQQIITIHILPNISGSKSNQAMKCGMLKKRSQKVFFSKIIQKMRQGD